MSRSIAGRSSLFNATLYGAGALLLLALAAMAGCDQARSQTPTPGGTPAAGGAAAAKNPMMAMKPPDVFVAKPEVMEVTDYEDFTGHLVPVQMVTLQSQVTGYLNKINFKDGDRVKAGDVLFEIEPTLYQADYNSKKALLGQAQTAATHAKADLDRAELTRASHSISQEQYDTYRFAYLDALAAVNTAQANMEVSKTNLDHTQIATTISGRVGKHLLDVGNMVSPTMSPAPSLAIVVTEDPIYAEFDVDERTLIKVHRLIQEGKISKYGYNVKMSLADENAFPESRVGTINFEDNQLDPQSATIRWRAQFPNPVGFFTPGMFVRVRVPIGAPHNAIVIPESALSSDQGRKFVYVIKTDTNTVEYRPVTEGMAVGDGKRAVDAGLTANDVIIVTGLQRAAMLPPGVPVNPKPYVPEKPASTTAPKRGA